MRNFLSQRVQSVPPSGIRRFFDIAATMNDVISLGIGEPDFTHARPDPGTRASVRCKPARRTTPPTPAQ